ncbi:hypothetical protein PENTCL1PPCAC_24233, partial [Pristionchus entomophagus]
CSWLLLPQIFLLNTFSALFLAHSICDVASANFFSSSSTFSLSLPSSTPRFESSKSSANSARNSASLAARHARWKFSFDLCNSC